MSESLTGRIGRIISGSLNSMIDAVENAVPETVMEEAIREIDTATNEIRTELGKVIANKHLANNRLMQENNQHEELSAKIELAIGEGRDDLAEAAVAKQLDIEAQIPILEATISEAGEKEKELESYIKALQAKKREMQEELKNFKASRQDQEAISSGSATTSGGAMQSKIDQADSAFNRVLEKATGLAGSPSDIKNSAQLAEVDELARKNRIQERLAAIKNQK